MANVPKKFAVKPFTSRKLMDSNEAQRTFQTLESGIHQIYNKKESEMSFEEHYRHGYNLVLNKHGDMLYNGLNEIIRRRLVDEKEALVLTPNEQLLARLARTWSEHKVIYSVIKDVMMYVDRSYVPQHRKAPVFTMAVLIFRSEILYHPDIRERVRSLLLQNVESERRGTLVDRGLMKEVLSMLGDFSVDGVNVYEEDFERHFLSSSRAFYSQEAQEYLAHNNCPEYLLKAESRLLEESDRVRHYLSSSTEPKIRSLVECEFLAVHAKALVDMEGSGAVALMKGDRLAELRKLYQLFSHVPSSLDCLRDAMGVFIRSHGTEIVADPENLKDPFNFVQKMIDFKMKFDVIIKESFRDDKKCYKKLKDSFEDFMNKDTRCPTFLASYADNLLKSGFKGMSEAEIEAQLELIIALFKFLSDKDIFESMYRTHFAKRLLNSKSLSEELERQMITKLKSECGQQYTSKMEGMFLDMHLAKEIMDSYRSSPFHMSNGFELDVQTLTASHWTMKSAPPCTLPAQVTSACESFQQYYWDRFKTGRRLTWLSQVGTADIKVRA